MAEPDQSLGRKILSFFLKEEPSGASGLATGTTPGESTPSKSTPVPVAPRPAPPVPAPPQTSTDVGAIDPKFAEHFANVLAQHNPPGPDYFEFRETLRSLSALGLPEDKQYQAAWASFKALGGPADVALLTNTANNYLAALQKDRDAFTQSVDATLTERVGGLQNEQKRLQTDNEALAKQVLAMQQQIDANATRLQAIGGEIADQSRKITQNRQNFETTFAHFVDQIKSDIRKITHYVN